MLRANIEIIQVLADFTENETLEIEVKKSKGADNYRIIFDVPGGEGLKVALTKKQINQLYYQIKH